MELLLISPPISNPFQPPLGIAVLSAYLRSRGISVVQKDMNIDFLKSVLSRSHVPRIAADFQDPEKFYDLRKHRELLKNFEEAVRSFFFSYGIDTGTANEFNLNSLGICSEGDIFKVIDNAKKNPFLNFLNACVPHMVRLDRPHVVGISVMHEDQLLPALTISRILKRIYHDMPVLIGGSSITYLRNRLARHHRLLALADAFVVHSGETAIERFLSLRDIKNDKHNIPNLVFKRRGEVIRTHIVLPPKADLRPPPNFDGFDLSSYFTPEPVLPISVTNRSCMYGMCAFCNTSFVNAENGEYKSPRKIYNDMAYLKRKYRCNHFIIYDDCVPVTILRQLSRFLIDSGQKHYVFCAIRSSEKIRHNDLKLFKKSGFVYLSFGFESVSDRMLKLFNKGRNNEHMMNILKNCRRSKIFVSLTSLIGFPGETVKEAKATIDFFNCGRSHFGGAIINVYSHEEESPAWRDPGKYGISIVGKKDGYGLFDEPHFKVLKGMSFHTAMKLLKTYAKPEKYLHVLGTVATMLYLSRHGFAKFKQMISN